MDSEWWYYNKPKIYNTDPRYISNAPVRSSLDVLPQFNDAFSYWKHMRVLNITYIRMCAHECEGTLSYMYEVTFNYCSNSCVKYYLIIHQFTILPSFPTRISRTSFWLVVCCYRQLFPFILFARFIYDTYYLIIFIWDYTSIFYKYVFGMSCCLHVKDTSQGVKLIIHIEPNINKVPFYVPTFVLILKGTILSLSGRKYDWS